MTQTVCLRPSGISDRMNRSASSKRSKSTRRRGSSRSQHSPSHHRTDAGLSPRRVSKPVKARVRYGSDVPSVAGECCLSKAQQPFRRASRQSRSKKAPPCGPRGRTGLSMRCRPRRGTPSSTDVCLTHPLNLPPGLATRKAPPRNTRDGARLEGEFVHEAEAQLAKELPHYEQLFRCFGSTPIAGAAAA